MDNEKINGIPEEETEAVEAEKVEEAVEETNVISEEAEAVEAETKSEV